MRIATNTSVQFSIFQRLNLVFLALYYSPVYSAPYFLAATVETTEARKCGAEYLKRQNYRIERTLQGICIILDTFISNQCISGLISVDKLYYWASFDRM